MTVATAAFCLLEAAIFLLLGDIAFGIAALASCGFLAAVLMARRLARRGRLHAAVITVATALQVLALVGVFAWPEARSMLIVLTLLATILALPYLSGPPLKRLMFVTWLALALIAVLAERLPSRTVAPEWLISAFSLVSLIAAAALLLLMLWLFNTRLGETLRDIQQAHDALRDSETRFRATFEQAAVGIAHVAPDGRWLRVNQRLCDIIGYSREELVQYTFQQITHPADLEADLQLVQQMLADEIQTSTLEKRYIRKGGEPIWVQLTVSLVRDGAAEPDYFIAVVQDISRRKLIEQERDQLYQETQQALQARDEFFQLAAHELRTPMTTILGSAQLLQRRLEQNEAITERDQRTMRALVDQGRRLHRLVLGLLDLSRMQQGALNVEREVVDVGGVVRHLVEELRPTLSQHSLELHIAEEPYQVLGDRLRIEEIIQNLLQNALKYSPEGGPITVELQRLGHAVAISISDQGIGIPDDEQARIFERFFRARNVDRDQLSGMGIGLYVARELVALHGGRIEVDSSLGEGSTFRIFLPAYGTIAVSQASEGGTSVSA